MLTGPQTIQLIGIFSDALYCSNKGDFCNFMANMGQAAALDRQLINMYETVGLGNKGDYLLGIARARKESLIEGLPFPYWTVGRELRICPESSVKEGETKRVSKIVADVIEEVGLDMGVKTYVNSTEPRDWNNIGVEIVLRDPSCDVSDTDRALAEFYSETRGVDVEKLSRYLSKERWRDPAYLHPTGERGHPHADVVITEHNLFMGEGSDLVREHSYSRGALILNEGEEKANVVSGIYQLLGEYTPIITGSPNVESDNPTDRVKALWKDLERRTALFLTT